MPYYSRLKMQTEAQDTKIQERDDRILGLLDQIANNMVRKEDVDRIVKDAVDDVNAKWQKRFDDYQEETEAKYKKQMEAMAAEYEAKIAEIRNQKDGKGDDKNQAPGKSTKNSRKKGGTVICNTMEEAMQRIQEEMNKAAVMQDQAFCGGSEKLSSEQRPAVNPKEENADDDSKVQSPVNLAFAYSLTESCKLNNINPYDYWSDLIDFIGCELLEQRRHTKASFLFAES